MGFFGYVIANNLFEVAGAVALAVACYNLGTWKERRFPNLHLITPVNIVGGILGIVALFFVMHLLFR